MTPAAPTDVAPISDANVVNWKWETVTGENLVTEHTLVGPDVLCRYWHDEQPSADALLIAAAKETAAARDRLVALNVELVKALEFYSNEAGYYSEHSTSRWFPMLDDSGKRARVVLAKRYTNST